MRDDAVASRYAQAIFEAAQAEQALPRVLEELTIIRQALSEVPQMSEFFLNPDVDPDQKIGVLEKGMRGSWLPLTKSFIQVVIDLGRAVDLPAIAERLQELVDQVERRLRVTVRSARPVSEALLTRLRTSLERREGGTIEMTTQLAPELLGGVQVFLGHRVIDGSIRRQLDELKQKLKTVQVA